MRICVLGATRPVGAHAAKKALDNGHQVVVLVRGGVDALPGNVKSHAIAGENLTVVKGDATNVDDLTKATEGCEAVLVCVGGGPKTTVVSQCVKILVTILPKTVKVVTVSNIGVGESRQYQNRFVKFFLIDRFMAGILKDKLIAETALANSGITKWTALRVGWLSNAVENLDRVKFVDIKDASTISRASRKDVGAVALKMVEDGYGEEYWGKAIHLCSD